MMKTYPRTIVALTALSLLTVLATGCTSGASWPSLAKGKKTPPSNSMAAYPKPPANRFTPKSTTTPAADVAKGYSKPEYVGANPSPTAGDYPSTNFGGSTYQAGDSRDVGASYNDPRGEQRGDPGLGGSGSSDRGYYTIPPRAGASSDSVGTGSGSPADNGAGYDNFGPADKYGPSDNNGASDEYAPKGGFDDARSDDVRSGSQTNRGGNDPSTADQSPWNSDANAAPWDSGKSGQGDVSTPAYDQPYQPKSSSAPWDNGASADNDSKYSEQADNSFQPSSKSFENEKSNNGFDSKPYSSDNAGISQLPSSLTQQKGGFQPGSIKKSYQAAPGDGGLNIRRDTNVDQGVRQVGYDNPDSSNDYPGNLPPSGQAFSNGTLDRGMNDAFDSDR